MTEKTQVSGCSDQICSSCSGTDFQKKGQVARQGKVFRALRCKGCGTHLYLPLTEKSDVYTKFLRSPEHVRELQKKKKFVITSAQNNTKTNVEFVKSLLVYCKENDAEFLVIPIRYANPNSFHVGFQGNYTWDEELRPYFIENRIEVGRHVQILADYYITATTSNPLGSIEQVLRNKTTIVGHPRLQMKTCPVLIDQDPVAAMTTGTLSVPNYSESKSGYMAEIHHTNSAVVLEIDDVNNVFHFRHVIADETGSFYDINGFYTPNGKSDLSRVSALVTGDEHAYVVDKMVMYSTYVARDSIARVLKPQYIVRHDLFDAMTVSHHDDKNLFLRAWKTKTGADDLEAELEATKTFLETTSEVVPDAINLIVASNHNDHLMQWMNSKHAHTDLINFDTYSELRYLIQNSSGSRDPFSLWLNKHSKPEVMNRTRFLNRRQSCKIAGVEVAMHGDVGSNGSKGSRAGIARLGIPAVIGHSHSPGIEGSVFQAGTSSSRFMPYNRGPSSNMNSHVVIYPNGKCQIINLIRGYWRLGSD